MLLATPHYSQCALTAASRQELWDTTVVLFDGAATQNFAFALSRPVDASHPWPLGLRSGCDAVLCALGNMRWFYPNRILSDGMRNVIRAMRELRISRLICETSLGVGTCVGRLGISYTLFTIPFILPFYFWDKRQEEIIHASSLEWRIVRPGVLSGARCWPKCGQCFDVAYRWASQQGSGFHDRTAAEAPKEFIVIVVTKLPHLKT